MEKHANVLGEKHKNVSEVWRKEKKKGIKIVFVEEIIWLFL